MSIEALYEARATFQAEFIGNFFEGESAATFDELGQCKHWLFDIYRTPDVWCFKAGVPITAQQARAVARYLEELTVINPPVGGAVMEAAINAQNAAIASKPIA